MQSILKGDKGRFRFLFSIVESNTREPANALLRLVNYAQCAPLGSAQPVQNLCNLRETLWKFALRKQYVEFCATHEITFLFEK